MTLVAPARRSGSRLSRGVLDSLRALSAANDLLDAAVCDYLGLHRTDLRCLDWLARLGPLTAGRLGAAVGLTSGALTIAVDRLEHDGYVIRVAHPTDRRRVIVRLAPGADRVIAVFAELRQSTLRLLGGRDDPELQLLTRFLVDMTTTFEDQAKDIRRRAESTRA